MPRMLGLKVAVIEGKWFPNKNVSVKSMFDTLSDIHCNTSHGYHYEMFNNGSSFREIVQRLGTMSHIHYIYVAAHGNDTGIVGASGEDISRSKIKNALEKATLHRSSSLRGLFFGACNFVDSELAEFIIERHSVDIEWIAGYSKEIDWIESSAFDWFFWNQLARYTTNKSKRGRPAIMATAAYVNKYLKPLVTKLGFQLFHKNDSGSCENLVG